MVLSAATAVGLTLVLAFLFGGGARTASSAGGGLFTRFIGALIDLANRLMPGG